MGPTRSTAHPSSTQPLEEAILRLLAKPLQHPNKVALGII